MDTKIHTAGDVEKVTSATWDDGVGITSRSCGDVIEIDGAEKIIYRLTITTLILSADPLSSASCT